MCILIFSATLHATFLIPRRIQRDITVSTHTFLCEVPVIRFRFNWNMNFLDRFTKNPSDIKFYANPVGGDLFHMDGRTDITKLIVAFRSFATASKNNVRGGNMQICI